MENKSKIIIGLLLLALVTVCVCLCANKPKKYTKIQYRQPGEQKPIVPNVTVVNNNDGVTDALNKLNERIGETKPKTIIEQVTAEECAERLYNAMLGHGTDSRAILAVFDYIDTEEEFDDVMEQFVLKYNVEFGDALANEMFSGAHIANKINEMLASRNINRMITFNE